MAGAKKSHPKFLVPNFGRSQRGRVKKRWRSQRGQDNKKRRGWRCMGASPSIGWRNPRSLRGLHPCGMREVLVHNAASLEGLSGAAIRIAKDVGKRKRDEIRKKAQSLSLEILN